MKHYYIIGIHNGKKQILDHCDTLKEAMALLIEYKLAYGSKWHIDIVLK